MGKLKNIFLIIFVLPLSIFLDFLLFTMTRSCPSCGSFNQWLSSEAALSFPLIVMLGGTINQLMTKLRLNKKFPFF